VSTKILPPALTTTRFVFGSILIWAMGFLLKVCMKMALERENARSSFFRRNAEIR
jgi:hypothetical protein